MAGVAARIFSSRSSSGPVRAVARWGTMLTSLICVAEGPATQNCLILPCRYPKSGRKACFKPQKRKKRPLRRRFRRSARGGPDQIGRSGMVSGLAMAGDVQAFAFLFFRYAQTDHDVDQLIGNERDHAGPDDRGADGFRLDLDLVEDGIRI